MSTYFIGLIICAVIYTVLLGISQRPKIRPKLQKIFNLRTFDITKNEDLAGSLIGFGIVGSLFWPLAILLIIGAVCLFIISFIVYTLFKLVKGNG